MRHRRNVAATLPLLALGVLALALALAQPRELLCFQPAQARPHTAHAIGVSQSATSPSTSIDHHLLSLLLKALPLVLLLLLAPCHVLLRRRTTVNKGLRHSIIIIVNTNIIIVIII
eukprot:COSAG01_NODE_13079_length_1639_cov_1.590260_1_plen_115_part_10